MRVSSTTMAARLARLEAWLMPESVWCQTCGYPVNRSPLRFVVTDDPSPLPSCPDIGQLLHPETCQPFGHCITRVCVEAEGSETS